WVTYPTSSFIPRREEFGVKDLRQYLQAFDDARPRTVEILISIRDKDALPLHCLQLAPAGAALNQWHLYGIAQDCLACDPSLSHIHSLIRIPNCCTSQWTDLASQKKIKPRRGNGSNERPTGRSRAGDQECPVETPLGSPMQRHQYHRVARLVVSLTGFARAGVHLRHVVRIISVRA